MSSTAESSFGLCGFVALLSPKNEVFSWSCGILFPCCTINVRLLVLSTLECKLVEGRTMLAVFCFPCLACRGHRSACLLSIKVDQWMAEQAVFVDPSNALGSLEVWVNLLGHSH